MAIVGLKTPYVNADGLPVYWPSDAGVVLRGGEVDFDGRHETTIEVDLTALPTVASGNQQIIHENAFLPNGCVVEEVWVYVTKAATGATATLDFGIVQKDRTTAVDLNGLVAAHTVATLTPVGTVSKLVVGSTFAGALIGTKVTTGGYFTANANTADFTAGKVNLRVYWSMPLAADL